MIYEQAHPDDNFLNTNTSNKSNNAVRPSTETQVDASRLFVTFYVFTSKLIKKNDFIN